MADKKGLNKYASEFEVRASTDEALKQLQSLTIEGLKLKTSYEQFNKALDKSPKLAGKYYDMLTSVQKQMKSLSNLSKIDLVPKKHLNEILDSVNSLKQDLSSLTNIPIIDENNIKEVQKIISKIYRKSEKSQAKIFDIEEQSRNFLDLEKNINEILDDVKNVKREFSNIGKESFKKTVEDLDRVQEDLYKVQIGGKKSVEELETLNNKFENSKKELELILKVSQKISGEDKTRNEAARLIFNTSGKIYEVMSKISDTSSRLYNKEISKQFENVHTNIVKINSDLEEAVLKGEKQFSSAEDYNKTIRTKMALLKDEQVKLDIILEKHDQIKKYEQDSISAKVKRAKIENDINRSYAKQILSQKRGLSGILDASKVLKDNLPNTAMATFGKNGVVAGKAITGAFGALTKIFAPLAALSGLTAIVKTAFDLERQVKNSRKQIFMMAMDTNVARDSFIDLSKGGNIINTQIEKMSKGFDSRNLIGLGINFEQAVQGANEFTKQGFKATGVYENLSEVSGGLFSQSASLGMEIGELASRAGQLRTEFGFNLNEVSTGFEQIRDDAKNANMSISTFFDKVINASVGLALWGQKLDLVSDVFSNLVKNMKLPEAVGAEIASGMAKSLSSLSTEMQITTYQLGKGKKQWKNYASSQKDANDKRIAAIDTEIEAAKIAGKSALVDALKKEKAAKLRDNATLNEYDSLKGLAGILARIRKMDVGSQITTQLQAIGGQFGINFEGNIEDVDTRLKNSMFEMEKLGEQFGFSREMMQGIQQLSTNLKLNVQGIREVAKTQTKDASSYDSLIDVLGGATRIQNAIRKEIGKDGVASQKELENIKQMFPYLKDSLGDYIKDGKFNYGEFDKVIRQQMADPQKKTAFIQSQMNKIFGADNKQSKMNFAKQLAQNELLGDYSEKLLTAIESGKEEEVAKVLGEINTSMELNGKQTTAILDKANVAAAKRAGAAMLRQTKSTEDAINNTIVKILRDGFRWLERLVNMFAFVNRTQLTQFNKLNDRLEENKEVAEKTLDSYRSKRSDVVGEIARLEELPEAQGAEKVEREKRISSLKDFLKVLDPAIASLEDLSKSTSNTSELFSREGSMTKEVINAQKELDKKAFTASEMVSRVTKSQSELEQNNEQLDLGKENTGIYRASVFEQEATIGSLFGGKKKDVLQNYTTPIEFGKPQVEPVKLEVKDAPIMSLNPFGNSNNFQLNGPFSMSTENQGNFKTPGFEDGGIVPGNSFTGDKVLSALNSGELVIPKNIWQNLIPETSKVGKNSLENISETLNSDVSKKPVVNNTSTEKKTINDNRVINISVNQNDRRTVEQIVLNAIYSDKIK